jgi:hypothetical protein
MELIGGKVSSPACGERYVPRSIALLVALECTSMRMASTSAWTHGTDWIKECAADSFFPPGIAAIDSCRRGTGCNGDRSRRRIPAASAAELQT